MHTSRCKLTHYLKPVIGKIGDKVYRCCCFAMQLISLLDTKIYQKTKFSSSKKDIHGRDGRD